MKVSVLCLSVLNIQLDLMDNLPKVPPKLHTAEATVLILLTFTHIHTTLIKASSCINLHNMGLCYGKEVQ